MNPGLQARASTCWADSAIRGTLTQIRPGAPAVVHGGAGDDRVSVVGDPPLYRFGPTQFTAKKAMTASAEDPTTTRSTAAADGM